MIRSMTAFARQQAEGDWGSLTLELRSVNHRYLEFTPRLPEDVRVVEPKLRTLVNERLGRGKVECNVRYQAPTHNAQGDLHIDRELVQQLAHASREVDQILFNPAPVSSLEMLRWPGVLQTPEVDQQALHTALLDLLEQGLDELNANREREGERLRELILQRCEAMEEVVAGVRERLPKILDGQRQRLRNRLEELKGELDEERLEQEMVILAQKVDVDEELDRLDTHLAEVRRVLEQSKPVGRRLDFLMQELNREANTLGSKSIDSETTAAAVNLKVYIEQMREQVQNIE